MVVESVNFFCGSGDMKCKGGVRCSTNGVETGTCQM
jgi:hypothetical protein